MVRWSTSRHVSSPHRILSGPVGTSHAAGRPVTHVYDPDHPPSVLSAPSPPHSGSGWTALGSQSTHDRTRGGTLETPSATCPARSRGSFSYDPEPLGRPVSHLTRDPVSDYESPSRLLLSSVTPGRVSPPETDGPLQYHGALPVPRLLVPRGGSRPLNEGEPARASWTFFHPSTPDHRLRGSRDVPPDSGGTGGQTGSRRRENTSTPWTRKKSTRTKNRYDATLTSTSPPTHSPRTREEDRVYPRTVRGDTGR